jgi:hypothetical protein
VAAPLAGGATVSVPLGAGGVGDTLVGGAVGVASALGDGGTVGGGVALGRRVGLGVFDGEGVRVGLGRTLCEGDGFDEGRAGALVTGVTSTGLGDDSGRGGRIHR